MSLTQLQLLAALAEQVYNRDSNDDPITLEQLGLAKAEVPAPAGLAPSNGFYYSPRGFVGEVVTDGSTVYLVFRGTDLSISFQSALGAAIASGLNQYSTPANMPPPSSV